MRIRDSRMGGLTAAAVVLAIAGCGGTTTSGSGNGGSEDPCALATPAMVGTAFGGSAADGEPGGARNCTYAIEGGVAPDVDVYHYGSAGSWDGTRQGFEDNRGGTTDVPGLGTAAFHPNDAGPSELVVQAGGVIFSVSTGIFGGSDPAGEAAVLALAQAIAAAQG